MVMMRDVVFFLRVTHFFFTGSKPEAIGLTFTYDCVFSSLCSSLIAPKCSTTYRIFNILHNSCVIYYNIAFMNSKTKVGMQAEIIISVIIISL